MIIFFLGPAGSGKGTQAKLLADKYNLSYISTGDMLREIAKEDDSVAQMLSTGVLFPDEKVLDLLQRFLKGKGITDDLILDGIPRRYSQYEALLKILGKVDLVILLEISKDEVIRRLSARRTDRVTGKVYNLVTNPPGPEVDTSNLVARDDDKPEAIEMRYKTQYVDGVLPMVEKISNEKFFVKVDGERSIEDIQDELVKVVEKFKNAEN